MTSAIQELLSYDPETGVISWKVSNNRRREGEEAGSLVSSGYRVVCVAGKNRYAHRLAWLLHYGREPVGQLDHIDGDRANNALSNLREVSAAENQQNKRKPFRASRTGFIGVSKVGDKFRADIRVDGKNVYLGLYATAEQAHSAYVLKKREVHQGYVE